MKRQNFRKLVSLLLMLMILAGDFPVALFEQQPQFTTVLAETVSDGEQSTETPTPEPTEAPTPEPTPTEEPTIEPTEALTEAPTEEPTAVPSEEPTLEPTEEPTPEPSEEPTPEPTEEPTLEPTEEPTPEPSEEPIPNPYYTDEDFYTAIIAWPFEALPDQVLPEFPPLALEAKLEYLDEELNWQPVAPLETPDAYSAFHSLALGESVTLRIPMLGLPIEREYRARLVPVDGYNLTHEDFTLSTSATLEAIPVAMDFGFGGMTPFIIVNKPIEIEIALTVNFSDAPLTDKLVAILPDNDSFTETYSSQENGISYKLTLSSDAGDNIAYSIEVTAPDFDLHPKGTITGAYTEGMSAIDLRALKFTEHTLTKKWNDNNSNDRPSKTSYKLQVKEKTASPSAWADDSHTSVFDFDDSNWDSKNHNFTHLRSFDDAGKELEYRVVEIMSDMGNYVVTSKETAGLTVITNTRKTSITIDKQWHDVGAPGARPSTGNWEGSLTLKRKSSDVSDETVAPGDYTSSVSGGDTPSWEATFGNLPMYDASGNPYTYYIEEDTDSWDGPSAFGDYVTAIENVGEHREKNDVLYDGGTSTSTIEAEITFSFNKKWADGDGTGRPDLVFELYRMMLDPTKPDAKPSVSTASPVSGMDRMDIDSSEFDFSSPITYKVGDNDKLPRYGPEGREYLYFLVEKYVGIATDYVQVLENKDLYLYNAFPPKTILNQKQKTVYPTATKQMEARALQNEQIDITFGLERRSLGDPQYPDNPFVPVEDATLTIEGFTAEKMQQTGTFSEGYPGYDEDGYPYEYRAVEKSIRIDGDEDSDEDENGIFEAGGYSFEMTVDPDGTIVNTLIGETAIGVNKTWSPSWEPTMGTPSITVSIYQNGELYKDLPASGTLEGNLGFVNDDGIITITATSTDPDFSTLFVDLPKYDEGGRPYEYTLKEIDCSDPYSFEDLTYSQAEKTPYGTYNVANIVNTYGPGNRLEFNVSKIWLDDGDSGHRETVTMRLYYNQNAGQEDGPAYMPVADSSFTLSASDVWSKRYFYVPKGQDGEPLSYYADDPQWQYKNYIVREDKVGNGTVLYGDAIAIGDGSVEAQWHHYKVSHTRPNENSGNFTVTNLRVGKLKVVLNKTWAVGKLKDLELEFELYQNGSLLAPTKILPWGERQVMFEDLDKYDNKGAIISYSANETGIREDSFSPFVPFAGNIADLGINGKIVKSISSEPYVVGPKHTNDIMTYNVKNTRSEFAILSINKVWRDEKADLATRPDITLILTRTSPDNPTPTSLVIENAQRNWDTTPHHWYWTCDFGTLPRYDADGYEYQYQVTEQIKQVGLYYTQTYYNGDAQPDKTGGNNSSEDIFTPMGNADYALAAFNDAKRGTIINTVQQELTIPGFKLWANMPPWFKAADLPDVSVKLYCATTLSPDDKVWIATTTIENGATTFEFTKTDGDPSLPLYYYNDYGVRYIYTIQEEPIVGYGVSTDQANFTITNTYEGDTKKVNITVTKEWDWSDRDSEQVDYPEVTFDLWQSWNNDSYKEIFETASIAGGAIVNWSTPQSVSFDNLPYYAPDGTPFTYTVTEQPIVGYTTETTVPLNIGLDGENYKGETTFKNTYTPEEQASIIATKRWIDTGYKDELRPPFNADQTKVIYTLWRMLPDETGEPMASRVNPPVWSEYDENTWRCTFTVKNGESLPTYSTTGEKYIYYVEETLAAPYNQIYTLVPGNPSLTLENKLNTVQASFTKEWRDSETGEIIPKPHLTPMLKFLPDALHFSLYYNTDNSDTWYPFVPDISYAYRIDTILNSTEVRIFTEQHLPKYGIDNDGTTLLTYYYKIQETNVAPFITVTYDHDKPYHTIITNSFAVRKLFFAKNWADENNQDGVRPPTILFTVKEGANGPTSTVTLSKNTTSTDPEISTSPATHEPTQSRWVAELWLPDMKVDNSGKAVYSATEACPTELGYNAAQGDPVTNADHTWFSFTNSRNVQLVSIDIEKIWSNETVWTTRPNSVQFTLQVHTGSGEDGWEDASASLTGYGLPSITNPITLNAPNWTDENVWTALPAFKPKTGAPTSPAVAIEYRVVEKPVPTGYESSSPAILAIKATDEVVSASITNTFKTVDISGKKTWSDNNDQYGYRPNSITLEVLANGSSMSPRLLIDDVTAPLWTYSCKNLPEFASDGSAITYSVAEVSVPYGYETPTKPSTSLNLTNTFSTVDISGTKTWTDSGNRYATKPDSIELLVFADDIEITSLLNPTQIVWSNSSLTSDIWNYTISGLPKYHRDGTLVAKYTVQEVPVTGYKQINSPGKDLENELETVTLTGTKTWLDHDNLYKMRPAMQHSAFKLVVCDASKTPLAVQPLDTDINWTVSPDDSNIWEYEIAGLPKYVKGSDPKIEAVYYVDEEIPNDYTMSDNDGRNITNTLKTMSISGTKTWSDFDNLYHTRPDSIVLSVYVFGEPLSIPLQIDWSNTDTDVWQYRINNLPRYYIKDDGSIVHASYTVRETTLPNYACSPDELTYVAATDVTDADFSNILITASISGTKNWDDKSNRYGYRPQDISLTLFANGVKMVPQPDASSIIWTMNPGDVWQYTISGLPVYPVTGSTPITYTVQEHPIPNYTQMNAPGMDLTNKLETVVLSGTKTWVDDNNLYKKRPSMDPASFELVVCDAQGTPLALQPLPADILWTETSDSVWTYEIFGLPKYTKGSQPPVEAVYLVKETLPTDYVLTASDNRSFTNTLETIVLSGTKTWEDFSNLYQLRPNTIELLVYVCDELLSPQPKIVWNNTDTDVWNYRIDNLSRYHILNGVVVPAVYTVKETPLTNYDSAPSEIVRTGTSDIVDANFTNTLITTELIGTKTWMDDDDTRMARPSDIELTVYADGAVLSPKPAVNWKKPTGNVWSYAIPNLPKYQEDGVTPVLYSVEETPLHDYTSTISGFDITNTIICALTIDNTTINKSNLRTNAGGFVNVGSVSTGQRDTDAAPDGGLSVYWKPEENWVTDSIIKITYYLYGSTVPKVANVTVNDISALTGGDFPNAMIMQARAINGGYTLRFANSLAEMPRLVEVEILYKPTIAGLNISKYNNSGEVSVEGGQWDPVSDGVDNRYVQHIVLEKSEPGFVVDMKGLRIGLPGDVALGQGTLITPNANGSFTATLNVSLAGEPATVTIRGLVETLNTNSRGEPTSVSVSLYDMPCPLDVGIGFVPEKKSTQTEPGPETTPQTGDDRAFDFYYALLTAGILSMAFGLFLLLRKRKTVQ